MTKQLVQIFWSVYVVSRLFETNIYAMVKLCEMCEQNIYK